MPAQENFGKSLPMKWILCLQLVLVAPAVIHPVDSRYETLCRVQSDINEHLPVLRELASKCSSVVEIGMRSMVSTAGLLQGLAENPDPFRSYVGIDISLPPFSTLQQSRQFADEQGFSFAFWHDNDMNIEIPETELLFIDSLHTYCHLSYELEKFAPSVSKYIAMHDTSAPWGDADDSDYKGDYTEYPAKYNRQKRGLWPAVVDFLASHPEWRLQERRLNNHGFTILKRTYFP